MRSFIFSPKIKILLLSLWAISSFNAHGVQCRDLLYFEGIQSTITPKVSRKGLRHILEGEIGYNATTKQPVISGGLHTLKGFNSFLKTRKDLFEFGSRKIEFDSEDVQNWYFLYENPDNGVVYVKLPDSAYSSKALKGLRQAEYNDKGSEGWKTLFPKDLTFDDLLSGLNTPIPRKYFQDMGWALKSDILVHLSDGRSLSVTLVLNKKNNEVITAFPSFSQVGADFAAGLISRNPMIKVVDSPPSFELPQMTGQPLLVLNNPHAGRRVILPEAPLFPELKDLQATYQRHQVSAVVMASPRMQYSISGVEFYLGLLNPKYSAGDYSKKVVQALDEFLKRKTISTSQKLEVLQTFLVNHIVYDQSLFIDIAVGQYLISKILTYAAQEDLKIRQEVLRSLEYSSLYWLLFLPQNTFVNTHSSVLRSLSQNMGVEVSSRSAQAAQAVAEISLLTDSLDWKYFDIKSQTIRQDEDYANAHNRKFVKHLIEFVNRKLFFSTLYELYMRSPEKEDLVRVISNKEISKERVDLKISLLLEELRSRREVFVPVVFQEETHFELWLSQIQKLFGSKNNDFTNMQSIDWPLEDTTRAFVNNEVMARSKTLSYNTGDLIYIPRLKLAEKRSHVMASPVFSHYLWIY